MKYLYYAKAFDHKVIDKENGIILKYTYESEYNKLSDITNTWQHGYTLSFRNTDKVQVIVIDIDEIALGMSDTAIRKFNEKYVNKFWLTRGCTFFDKTSEKYETKKDITWKIFAWLDEPIDNTKEMLEIMTNEKIEKLKSLESYYMADISVDEHQFNPTQLTYGKPVTKLFAESDLNGLPLHENDVHIEHEYKNKKTDNEPSLNYFMNIFEKENESGHQIGVTKKDILAWVKHWYHNKHNKSLTKQSTYRIIAKTYTPYMKAEYDNDGNLARMVQVIVHDKRRHFVANKLVDIIAFNAFARSVFYRDIPSISDCYRRLAAICNMTFEQKDDKNWIDCWSDEYKNKLKDAYRNYLKDCDWTEYKKDDDDLMDYIACYSNRLDQEDIQWTYRPNDSELERFTKDNDYMMMLVEYADKNRDYYTIWDAIGPDCGGDVTLMCKLMNALRRRVDFKIPKERNDKGKSHKEHKKHKKHKEHKEHSNKGKCLDGYTIEDNTVTIPKSIKVSSSIRKYCSKNNIKIIRC